jgi:hypothetical protein
LSRAAVIAAESRPPFDGRPTFICATLYVDVCLSRRVNQ